MSTIYLQPSYYIADFDGDSLTSYQLFTYDGRIAEISQIPVPVTEAENTTDWQAYNLVEAGSWHPTPIAATPEPGYLLLLVVMVLLVSIKVTFDKLERQGRDKTQRGPTE